MMNKDNLWPFVVPESAAPCGKPRVELVEKEFGLAAKAETIVTAGLRPELFPQRAAILASRTLVMATLPLLV